MNPFTAFSGVLLMGGLLCLAGCSKAPTPAAPRAGGVAEVGDAVITPAQVQQKLAERHRRGSVAPLTAADRDAALEELIQFEALFAQAQRAGWHTNAEVLAGFKRAVVGRFKEEQLARATTTTPTDPDIGAFYDQHVAQFTMPAKMRGAVILLETPAKAAPEKRAESAARVAALREQGAGETAANHFASLAQRHSVDQATRYAGGDFGLLTAGEVEGRYGAELARALAALKSPGEVSAVVETPRGLGFVKLIERKAESRRPLAQVRDGIVHQLSKAKQAQAEHEFQASARRGVEVRIHREVLDSIPLPNRNDEPPALPGVETAQARIP